MGAGTGKLISEMLSDNAPHLDITPYRIRRF
jgi:glycine/D-amino acid oxidase-like deaminating enzyme